MSAVTLEHAVGAALDVQLAADLTGDMLNVARTLFALPLAPTPTPIPPEAAHVPAAVPVAIPPLPSLPAPEALPMPSALPVPALEVPAALPADPAEDVVAIPVSTVVPHSMAMLSEIAFLDD